MSLSGKHARTAGLPGGPRCRRFAIEAAGIDRAQIAVMAIDVTAQRQTGAEDVLQILCRHCSRGQVEPSRVIVVAQACAVGRRQQQIVGLIGVGGSPQRLPALPPRIVPAADRSQNRLPVGHHLPLAGTVKRSAT